MQSTPFPFAKSRLSILNYCWKCNDSSHLYTNCTTETTLKNFILEPEAKNAVYSVFHFNNVPILDQCSICLHENVCSRETLYLNCKHGFCDDCITKQIQNNILTCALCRKTIKYFVMPKHI